MNFNSRTPIKTLFLLIVWLLASCNNKSNTTIPVGPTCPAGQVATPAGCALQGNMIPPVGYIQPNGTIQYFASKSDFIAAKDTLTLTSNYRTFLKEALGVCDRCYTTAGQGLECDSWLRGFNMLMMSLAATNSTATHQLAFYSTPQLTQSYYYFAWQFPKVEDFFLTLFTGVPAPSCNNGGFHPYWATNVQYDSANSGKGFVLYVNYGPVDSTWNHYKFRLKIPSGKVGDATLNFQLTVIKTNLSGKDESFDLATGTFTRCQTANCGMF